MFNRALDTPQTFFGKFTQAVSIENVPIIPKEIFEVMAFL